jgi:hypothetical protein
LDCAPDSFSKGPLAGALLLFTAELLAIILPPIAGTMKNLILTLALLAAVLFGWHVYVCSLMERNLRNLLGDAPNINPVTDVATIKTPGPKAFGLTDMANVSSFYIARDNTAKPSAKSAFDLYAREHMDLYAMIFQYQIKIVDE